jgi:transcriptional activator for dhaKLM operon
MNDPLLAAWQAFLTTGACDDSAVSPAVLRSWQRCAAAGLDPRATDAPDAPDDPPPPVAREALIALARPAMEDLYQFVEGSGFAVLLADPGLRLIELIGDTPILATIEALGLGRGASWREERIGTTAMSLALHEALPWQTRGAEHYRAAYHPFACSAAPLFDIAGHANGVPGVLGPRAAAHAHTLGMVIATAQAIHTQARNDLLLAETNDHLAELNAAIEAMSEGLIMVNAEGRLSKINSRAGAILGLSSRSVAGRPLEALVELPDALRAALERRGELADQEMLFGGRRGATTAVCSVRPVWDRGRRYLGALITLRPPESVQRLVQQVVGAQARFTFADILGDSPPMQSALRQARAAARATTPVLLVGEPGVGKQLFAHAIHNASPRAGGPFVTLSCNAVSRALVLGELLGYEGGVRREREDEALSEGRPGRLELAQGGTLVLEEIGALPAEAQTSLLRVIETRNLLRVGGRRVVPLDVRIIALTSRDLQRDVAEGRFRAELYYRLSMQTIYIPPLRRRGDDVLLLINQMLAAMNRRMGKQALLAPDALAALVRYGWPGNVRELEATLERLLDSTEKSVLTLADLPPAIARAAPDGAALPPGARLYDRHAVAEREAILHAGREAAGHLGRAASRLGISRATLWRKMKLYGISKEHFWQEAGFKSPAPGAGLLKPEAQSPKPEVRSQAPDARK